MTPTDRPTVRLTVTGQEVERVVEARRYCRLPA
jgi:hypothetical protein